MKTWTQNFLTATNRSLVLAACVAGLGAGQLARAAEATNLHDHATIAPLQLIDGDYSFESPTDKKAKCVKVKTKLELKRTAFKASSEWRTVTGSDAYKSYEESHKALKDKNCETAAAGAEMDACKALTDKVTQQADVLAETIHWKALTASKSWHGLMAEFSAAEKLGCIKPNPAKDAVK